MVLTMLVSIRVVSCGVGKHWGARGCAAEGGSPRRALGTGDIALSR